MKAGDKVRWRWGQGTAEGTVRTAYARKVTRKLKGADSTRADVFVCAAEGCERRGGKRGPFRECAGPCDPFWKPHYCSRQCQKKVSTSPSFLAEYVSPVRLMILPC